MRIALLIQGPILSVGRGGNTNKLSKSVAEKDILKFSCVDNINILLKNFGYLFSTVVLSTWKSEDTSGLVADDKFLITKLDEPAVNTNSKKKLLPNNKIKQFIGIKGGIDFIESHNPDIDFLVRVRTDQYIDLAALVNWLKQNEQKLKGKIAIPHFRLNTEASVIAPYIPDFYFVSHPADLRNLCVSMIELGNKEFAYSVHYDVFLKYLYKSDFLKQYHNPEFIFSYSNYYSKEFFLITQSFLENAFLSLPKFIYEGIEWRGEHWNQDNIDAINDTRKHVFDFSPASCSSGQLPVIANSFIRYYFVDYSKYFEFKGVKLNIFQDVGFKILRRLALLYYTNVTSRTSKKVNISFASS